MPNYAVNGPCDSAVVEIMKRTALEDLMRSPPPSLHPKEQQAQVRTPCRNERQVRVSSLPASMSSSSGEQPHLLSQGAAAQVSSYIFTPREQQVQMSSTTSRPKEQQLQDYIENTAPTLAHANCTWHIFKRCRFIDSKNLPASKFLYRRR